MSKSSKEAWDAAAKASADREASEAPKKRGRGKKGEQQRLPIAANDEVKVEVKIELHRAMTEEEWDEQAAVLAKHRVELMALEDEIARLKRKHAPRIKELKGQIDTGARQVDAREWLTLTDCIEVHNPNTRTVRTYASVDGEPGAQVLPDRAMREDEFKRATETAPFAAPLEAPTGGQSEAP